MTARKRAIEIHEKKLAAERQLLEKLLAGMQILDKSSGTISDVSEDRVTELRRKIKEREEHIVELRTEDR